ncbi:hypothetical protein TIFTF001_028635 [Ficus carica]|uniref:Uncharacterized protein n=1 Tax=Ficus carica TaxID=3494 RepID=A0AA88DQB1_FICCA|nr:hypothetical protein TIFTF001_028635 [Ficus carica]
MAGARVEMGGALPCGRSQLNPISTIGDHQILERKRREKEAGSENESMEDDKN